MKNTKLYIKLILLESTKYKIYFLVMHVSVSTFIIYLLSFWEIKVAQIS